MTQPEIGWVYLGRTLRVSCGPLVCTRDKNGMSEHLKSHDGKCVLEAAA